MRPCPDPHNLTTISLPFLSLPMRPERSVPQRVSGRKYGFAPQIQCRSAARRASLHSRKTSNVNIIRGMAVNPTPWKIVQRWVIATMAVSAVTLIISIRLVPLPIGSLLVAAIAAVVVAWPRTWQIQWLDHFLRAPLAWQHCSSAVTSIRPRSAGRRARYCSVSPSSCFSPAWPCSDARRVSTYASRSPRSATGDRGIGLAPVRSA
jgi:hypothetical protein